MCVHFNMMTFSQIEFIMCMIQDEELNQTPGTDFPVVTL